MKIDPELEKKLLALPGVTVRQHGRIISGDDKPLPKLSDTWPKSEKEWTAQVIAFAEANGWKCYHTHDSRRSQEGFPDLILLRGNRQLAVELKMDKLQPKPAQQEWLDAFAMIPGCVVACWHPMDRALVEETLK